MRRRRERLAGWIPLSGLVLGLLLGVAYTWLVSPVQYFDTAPRSLRQDFKEQYRVAIAEAYAANSNLERARARLELLGQDNLAQELAGQAQRMLAAGYPQQAGALAQLSSHLQNPPTQAAPPATTTPTPSATPAAETSPSATLDLTQSVRTATSVPSLTPSLTPLASFTPRPTFTPRPSSTPTATPGAPFALQNQREMCDPAQPHRLLQIEVVDSKGNPVAGARVTVSWPGGEESFLTGLYPRISPGYADFEMTSGVSYTVRVGEGGLPAEGFQTLACQAPNGDPFEGGWWLIFAQP